MLIGVECSGIYGMHFRLTYILNNDWNSVLPDKEFLVVGTGNELLVVVEESDGVDCREMLVVLLHPLS